MGELPCFKYHPDPIATGSVVPSYGVCVCCTHVRRFFYKGAAYGLGDRPDRLCPWCIADGSAHEKLGITFTDERGIGGGEWDSVPAEVIEEVAYRTPGFCSWQQEMWWTHCKDAAQFLGPVGQMELEVWGHKAVEAIRKDVEALGFDWERVLQELERDGSPVAYLFRCRHCGAFGGYHEWD